MALRCDLGTRFLFLKEAEKYHALPLDDRSGERFDAALVGRPDLMAGRTSLTVYEGMIGKPIYTYNYVGFSSSKVASPNVLPEGKVTIRYEYKYDGDGMGKGGVGTIFVNGEKVAEGRIDRTQPLVFSADEGADVGQDGETPVTDDYQEGDNKFTGKIGKVTIELK